MSSLKTNSCIYSAHLLASSYQGSPLYRGEVETALALAVRVRVLVFTEEEVLSKAGIDNVVPG